MLVSVILAICGAFILTVGALSTTGKLPGNSFIGLRIPEVRKSEDYWIMAHRIAGPAWLGSGVALLAAALVAMSAQGWLWLIVVLLVVGAVFMLGMGAALAAHTLARVDATRAEAEAAVADSACCSASPVNSADATATPSTPSSCASHANDTSGVVSAEECASGEACGSCSLNGSCEPAQSSSPALDLAAARRAVESQDQR